VRDWTNGYGDRSWLEAYGWLLLLVRRYQQRKTPFVSAMRALDDPCWMALKKVAGTLSFHNAG